MKKLIIGVAIFGYQLTFGQTIRVTNITGRAQIIGDISPNEARKEAINDAKLNALKAAGIEEKISSYQSLNTDQVNDSNKQNFESHIQSDILGEVKFDTITEERMITDSTGIIYEVKINAEVTPYKTDSGHPDSYRESVVSGQSENKAKETDTYTYPNGDSYTGRWLNGQRNGYGTYRFASGGEYVGYYQEGARNGKGVYYGPNGRYMTGDWNNGQLTHVEYFYDDQNRQKNSANYCLRKNSNNAINAPVASSQPVTPQDKLSNDENNFSKEADAQYQKMQ